MCPVSRNPLIWRALHRHLRVPRDVHGRTSVAEGMDVRELLAHGCPGAATEKFEPILRPRN